MVLVFCMNVDVQSLNSYFRRCRRTSITERMQMYFWCIDCSHSRRAAWISSAVFGHENKFETKWKFQAIENGDDFVTVVILWNQIFTQIFSTWNAIPTHDFSRSVCSHVCVHTFRNVCKSEMRDVSKFAITFSWCFVTNLSLYSFSVVYSSLFCLLIMVTCWMPLLWRKIKPL